MSHAVKPPPTPHPHPTPPSWVNKSRHRARGCYQHHTVSVFLPQLGKLKKASVLSYTPTYTPHMRKNARVCALILTAHHTTEGILEPNTPEITHYSSHNSKVSFLPSISLLVLAGSSRWSSESISILLWSLGAFIARRETGWGCYGGVCVHTLRISEIRSGHRTIGQSAVEISADLRFARSNFLQSYVNTALQRGHVEHML